MSKRAIGLMAAIAVLILGVVPVPAYAWHVWVGWPFWYPYPYYAPPVVVQPSAPVIVQPSTPTYVQPPATAAPSESSWYYCASSKQYYPYVKECPGGWQRVAPQPAS
jgi:hypothetical protein